MTTFDKIRSLLSGDPAPPGTVQQYAKEARFVDDLQVGLFEKADGSQWIRNPDGSETQVATGGNELAVTDGSTTVAATVVDFTSGATVTDGGDGVAQVAVGGGATVYQQNDDPGAVGAGSFWVNTTGINGTGDLPLLVRDPTNTIWSPIGLAHYDDTGQLRGFVTMSDTGIVMEKMNADGDTEAYVLLSDTHVYFSTAALPIWLSAAKLGGTQWGLSAPSGAEKFEGIPEPDDSEAFPTSQSTAAKIIWLDPDTGDSRFKVTIDSGATITPGKIAGLLPDGSSFLNVAPQDLSSALTVADVVAALVTLGLATS